MRFTRVPVRRIPVAVIAVCGCLGTSHGQAVPASFEPWLEFMAEQADDPESIDVSALADQLATWREDPVDLNSAAAEELVAWQLLPADAYEALQNHIARNGRLLSWLELQSIDGFSTDLIRLLREIATVESPESIPRSVSPGRMLTEGRRSLYLRMGRTIQRAAGFQGTEPAYPGSPDKIFLRYRHQHGHSLSYGLTLEKDAGETLLRAGGVPLPDFASWHISLQRPTAWIESLVAGDFTVSFGQGLVLNNGFGGAAPGTASIRRTGRTLRPYTSVDENRFFRGLAGHVRFDRHWTATVFLNRQKVDANYRPDSTLTSLQYSGLHRTAGELADQDIVQILQTGGQLGYTARRNGIHLNFLYSRLGDPLRRSPSLYNQFQFMGRRLVQASIDYNFFAGPLHFFGESALSRPGGTAHLAGLLVSPDRKVNLAVCFRSYGRAYQSITAQAFGVNPQPANEQGLYMAVQLLPSPRWHIDLGHDLWRHPWLRYTSDGPSQGQMHFIRAQYSVRRTMDLFIQYRYRRTEANVRYDHEPAARPLPRSTGQFRLQLNHSITRTVELRTRVAWTHHRQSERHTHGFLVAQDLLIAPLGSPWSCTARIALFDTDDYDTRIYTYENDLIHYYAIPAFSDVGTRYYITARYKGVRNITLECKLAETQYRNLPSTGSGNDRIEGNRRTEIRFQVVYRT